MTDPAFEHPLPWTEPEYWALGETTSRIELVDGCLWVGPHPGPAHQLIAGYLRQALDDNARDCGLQAVNHINLRLGDSRVANPDVVVIKGIPSNEDGLFVRASETTLVGEVVSEHSALSDTVLKRQLYADSGIGWYLLVEPSLPDYEAVTLRLLRLAGDHYVKHVVAGNGQSLRSHDPFRLRIHPSELLRFNDRFQVTRSD